MAENLKSAYDFNMQHSALLEDFITPLRTYCGIDHFCYAKFYNDGTILRISSNKDWNKKFFFHKFYNDQEIFCKQIQQTPLDNWCNFLITGQPQGKHLKLLHAFGLWHVFHMYKKMKNATELYVFSAQRDNDEICSYYLNNVPFLKQFIMHFKHQFENILQPNHAKLIYSTLPLKNQKANINANNSTFVKCYLPPIKKLFLDNEQHLTVRELAISKLLLSGLPIQSIAKQLLLSPRTIEIYLNTLKNKTDTYTKAQLIKKLKGLGLISIYTN